MSIGLSSTRTPGPDLNIHCPRCDQTSRAISYDVDEDVTFLWVIPLLTIHNTWVECIRCGARLQSKLKAGKLIKLSAQELAEVLVARVSLLAKLLAVVSVLFCWTPGLGVLLSAIAIIANWKSFGWPKLVSRIGAALSVVILLGLGIVYLVTQPGTQRNDSAKTPRFAVATGETAPGTIQKAMALLTPTLADTIAKANPETKVVARSVEPPPVENPQPSETVAPSPPVVAKMESDPRWIVVFSGKEPELWNSDVKAETFAIKLDNAPRDVRYLRLRRLDTGEALIIPIDYAQLIVQQTFRDSPNLPFRWNGINDQSYGGRHLGIAEGGLLKGLEKSGSVAVQMDGTDYLIGSGFGHEAYGDGHTQHFGWHGQKIEPTAFEIALTAGDLNDSERKSLLEASPAAESMEPLIINPTPAPTVTIPAPAKIDDDPRWVTLFRGRDPAAWNTAGKGATVARPLQAAPASMKYLRLKRLDTGESLIISLTRSELDRAVPDDNPRLNRWNGTNQDAFGGRHLGIAQGKKLAGSEHKDEGLVAVQTSGFDFYVGSGFGHAHHGDTSRQFFAWRGKTIPAVDFEISVTTASLRPSEQKAFLRP